MIIDIHTHIFPPRMRNDRKAYCASETVFAQLYDSPKSKMAGAADLVAAMDEHGVDKSVVFGFPWKNPDYNREHNDYVIEAVQRYPDRLIGYCCLDPFNANAAEETRRCFENGLGGVGELGFYRRGITDEAIETLVPIMALCRARDLPLLIHTNEPVGHLYPGKSPNTLVQIYNLARRFPENKIIMAHWGGGIFFYALLKKEVREVLKNVYYDTAAAPFLYDPKIYRHAIDIIGIDKILFGTDYPLLKPPRYFRDFEAAGLSPSEIAGIAGENARKLLGL